MSEKNLIGHTVRCVVTGFTGIAYQRTDMLGGTVQYSLQPKCQDDKNVMPDALSIDELQLDSVDAGISDRRTDPEYPAIDLGNEVKDKVSGLQGIVTSRVVFLNGCVYFNVEAPIKDGGKSDDLRHGFFAGARLDVIGAGVAEPKPVKRAASSTGGPMTRAQRPT